jgi:hypothetical protein
MHHRLLRVRLETERHVIEGTLQMPGEGYRSRMTDFLNSHDSDFLPVTDATLRERGDDRPAEPHPYLAVSVRHIVIGVELESLGTFDESGGEAAEPPTFIVSTPPPTGD